MSALDPVKNFGKVTLTAGYNSLVTSVVLSSGDGAKLPSPASDGSFNLVWYNSTDYPDPSDDPNREIVRCTARSTDTLTITRAQESTSASDHNISGKTYKMILAITKKMIDDIGSITDLFETPTPSTGDGSNNTFVTTYIPQAIVIGSPGLIVFENLGYTLDTSNQIIIDAAIIPGSGVPVRSIKSSTLATAPAPSGNFLTTAGGDVLTTAGGDPLTV